MNSWQQNFVLGFVLLNLVIFLKGFYETKYKRNAFGLTRSLFFLGIFVWGDAVILGLFWIITSIAALLLKDWYLFLLIISVFWLVRSLGETVYWLNQQFSTLNRNPVKNLLGHSIFHDDSVWFVYQLFWQCVMVVSIIFSIYFSWLWLRYL